MMAAETHAHHIDRPAHDHLHGHARNENTRSQRRKEP
jgi:hypothetical protein